MQSGVPISGIKKHFMILAISQDISGPVLSDTHRRTPTHLKTRVLKWILSSIQDCSFGLALFA